MYLIADTPSWLELLEARDINPIDMSCALTSG